MNLVEIRGRDLEETLTKVEVFGITVFESIGVFAIIEKCDYERST